MDLRFNRKTNDVLKKIYKNSISENPKAKAYTDDEIQYVDILEKAGFLAGVIGNKCCLSVKGISYLMNIKRQFWLFLLPTITSILSMLISLALLIVEVVLLLK